MEAKGNIGIVLVAIIVINMIRYGVTDGLIKAVLSLSSILIACIALWVVSSLVGKCRMVKENRHK